MLCGHGEVVRAGAVGQYLHHCSIGRHDQFRSTHNEIRPSYADSIASTDVLCCQPHVSFLHSMRKSTVFSGCSELK